MLRVTIDLIEKHAVKQSPSRMEELAKIFIHATKVSDEENENGLG
jgi:hypothetical protein